MKRKISKILLGTLIIFGLTKEVYAVNEVDFYNTYLRCESNSTCDGNNAIKKNTKASDGKYQDLPTIVIQDGTTGSNLYIAYCIDVGMNLENSGENDTISVHGQTLEQYLTNKIGNSEKAKEATKKINEYIYFSGYDIKASDRTNSSDARQKGEYYAATQELIWKVLSDAGYRTEEYNAVVPFRLGSNYSEIDLTKEKNEIINKINNHKKTPSFCSSQNKLEIAVGETATYKDNNQVLSNYEVSCSTGLKCEKQGNNLKVTVEKDSGEQKITFTKAGVGSDTVLYKQIIGSKENQGVVINQGKVEPVSCEFGIDTYKNVQTGGSLIMGVTFLAIAALSVTYMVYLNKTTFKIGKGA